MPVQLSEEHASEPHDFFPNSLLVFAMLLAQAPRWEGTLGRSRLGPIAKALREFQLLEAIWGSASGLHDGSPQQLQPTYIFGPGDWREVTGNGASRQMP